MDKLEFIPYPGAMPILRAEISETMHYTLPAVIQNLVDTESGTFRLTLDTGKTSAIGKILWATVLRFPEDVRCSFKDTAEGGSVLTLIIPRRKEV